MKPKKYEKTIHAYYPNTEEVEKMVTEKGIYSFYDSLDNRKECCDIRKVYPLKRALADVDLWITGLRAEQSVTRTNYIFWKKVVLLIASNSIPYYNGHWRKP